MMTPTPTSPTKAPPPPPRGTATIGIDVWQEIAKKLGHDICPAYTKEDATADAVSLALACGIRLSKTSSLLLPALPPTLPGCTTRLVPGSAATRLLFDDDSEAFHAFVAGGSSGSVGIPRTVCRVTGEMLYDFRRLRRALLASLLATDAENGSVAWLRHRLLSKHNKSLPPPPDWFLRAVLPMNPDEPMPFAEIGRMWRAVEQIAPRAKRTYVQSCVKRYLSGATDRLLSIIQFRDMVADLPGAFVVGRKMAVIEALEGREAKGGSLGTHFGRSYSNVADAIRDLPAGGSDEPMLRHGAVSRAWRLVAWSPLGIDSFWAPSHLVTQCVEFICGDYDDDDDERISDLFHAVNSLDMELVLRAKAHALDVSFDRVVLPHWIVACHVLGATVPVASLPLYRLRYFSDIIDVCAHFAEYQIEPICISATRGESPAAFAPPLQQHDDDDEGWQAHPDSMMINPLRFVPVVSEVYDYVTDRLSREIKRVLRLNPRCYMGHPCTHDDRYILGDPAELRKAFDHADNALRHLVDFGA